MWWIPEQSDEKSVSQKNKLFLHSSRNADPDLVGFGRLGLDLEFSTSYDPSARQAIKYR